MLCKITNKNEIHHGFAYQDGLNVFKGQVADGLDYTDLEHVSKFYGTGVWLREVKLPSEQEGFKVVQDSSGDKWRANMLVLGERHALYDYDTVKKFNLPITREYMRGAIKEGSVKLIDYLVANNQRVFAEIKKADVFELVGEDVEKRVYFHNMFVGISRRKKEEYLKKPKSELFKRYYQLSKLPRPV